MVKHIDSIWYQEGKKASLDNKSKSVCPYKTGTYGQAQWLKGFYDAKKCEKYNERL